MNKQQRKMAKQLGMNPSTASGRLVKDLLFKFVIEAGHKCFRCNGTLTRDTFSIEHKISWLDSDNSVGLFFDLDNIAYSHRSCNSAAGSRPYKYATEEERQQAKLDGHRRYKKKYYTKEKRQAQYRRTGK